MSGIWLLVLATGATPAEIADSANAGTVVVSSSAPAAETAARSPQQLRDAVAAALHRLDAANGADRATAVKSLVEVYRDLGRDQLLKPYDRSRLGSQVRTRLQRVANQLRFAANRAADAQADAPDTVAGWINDVVGGPGDWILAQRLGGPAGAQAGVGQPRGGGQGGSPLDQAANANGLALVDLIQKTVAPDSWDVNGGPGSATYYNNLRALVVRQTDEVHSSLDSVLNGLRRQ